MPKRKTNLLTEWIAPFQYSKIVGKNPTTINNAIKREQYDGEKADFKWKVHPDKPHKFLIEYIPNIEKDKREKLLEQAKRIVNVDQKIQEEKLKKLELSNKKEAGLSVDKDLFNKEYFIFLRSARNELQSLVRKWRVKKDKVSEHEFENLCMEDVNKILTKLSKFEYYDKDDNKNT